MSISTDYSSAYGSAYSSVAGITGAFLIFFIVMMILSLALCVVMVISQWKIFGKNNKPGWYSVIPFLNTWTLFEIVGIQGWWSLIPFANIVFMYIANYKLPIKMGKSSGFAVMNIFFPFVGYPIMAFSKGQDNVSGTGNVNVISNSQVINSTTNFNEGIQQGIAPTINSNVANSFNDMNVEVQAALPNNKEISQVTNSNDSVDPSQNSVGNLQNQANSCVTSCPGCGATTVDGNAFCTVCGTKLK